MSSSNQPVNPGDLQSTTNKRIDALERKLNLAFGQFKPEIVFSYSGPVAAVGSPSYEFGIAERSYILVARLVVPGSTDTAVDLLKNGDTVATVTVQAGQYRGARPLSVSWAPDSDELRFLTTAAGTGAEELTVIARFKLAP